MAKPGPSADMHRCIHGKYMQPKRLAIGQEPPGTWDDRCGMCGTSHF